MKRDLQRHIQGHIQRNIQRYTQDHFQRHIQRHIQCHLQRHVYRHIQRQLICFEEGVGLLEVLLALVLLSVTLLGYSTLQLHAMNAAQTANQRLQAMSLVRDLTERMRVNRQGLAGYQTQTINSKVPSCGVGAGGDFCQPLQMAAYDLAEVQEKAKALAMQLAVLPCQNTSRRRQCIYVAWGQTKPSDGESPQDCTYGGAYVLHSRCIVMEVYDVAT